MTVKQIIGAVLIVVGVTCIWRAYGVHVRTSMGALLTVTGASALSLGIVVMAE